MSLQELAEAETAISDAVAAATAAIAARKKAKRTKKAMEKANTKDSKSQAIVATSGAGGPTSRLVPGPQQVDTVVEEFELLKGRRFNASKQYWRGMGNESEEAYVDTERLNMQVCHSHGYEYM